jgi:hypothetical protein
VRRAVPVGDEPDAHRVEVRGRQVQRAGAVRRVHAWRADAALREAREQRAEAVHLVTREGEVIAVGVGKCV